MTELDLLHLNLNISIYGSTEEELDNTTRQLFIQLKDLDLESVKLVSDSKAPSGTKGVDPITAGTIALAVLPNMLPKILEFLQSWSLQGNGRTMKFKGKIANQQIDFEGSFDEMQKVVAMLEKKRPKSKK